MREVKYHEDDKEEKVKKKAAGEQLTQKMAYEWRPTVGSEESLSAEGQQGTDPEAGEAGRSA